MAVQVHLKIINKEIIKLKISTWYQHIDEHTQQKKVKTDDYH